jgi:hypothetical protein
MYKLLYVVPALFNVVRVLFDAARSHCNVVGLLFNMKRLRLNVGSVLSGVSGVMKGGSLNGLTLPSPGGLGVRLGEGLGVRAAGCGCRLSKHPPRQSLDRLFEVPLLSRESCWQSGVVGIPACPVVPCPGLTSTTSRGGVW